MRYVFGDCVLDCGTRQLRRAGSDVPFSPKAFELLELLVRCRPQAVSRTRLTAALWANTHVGPTSLHVLVSQVRAALDDEATTPRWIRTVPRFGYAFVGAATEEASGTGEDARPLAAPAPEGPRLVFDDEEIALEEGENVIGREKGMRVRIDSPGVSRRHARIVVTGAEATLEDLGSKNGTFVSEDRLRAPRALEDGDVVRLGWKVRFVFARGGERRTETEGP